MGPLSNRITQRDERFRVNVSTRILNDPVNDSGLPNQHAALSRNVLNSTFEAVFRNAITGLEEIYLLGPTTLGYPLLAGRRVDLTVTEPNLTFVKTACNESLSVTGPSCTPFTTLVNNGDTFDNYIYRIVVTNGASARGVARAPAYDVIVTDLLDANDLALVLPFAGDGLDNDGDLLIDGADSGVEGSISDNIVNNGTPATLTFSYTHSPALQRINPGTSVNLYYRVDPHQNLQPGQTLLNRVNATYDSLSGPSGAQTVIAYASGTIGGARTYTSAVATATVQVVRPTTQPKRIVTLSQANHGTPTTMPTPQPVSVGEEIRYELSTLLPIANLRNFVITDNLPVGVRCSEALAVNLSAAPYLGAGFVPGGTFTPTCTDTQVMWNFGTQALTNGSGIGLYDFVINFIGRVENTANTNDGNVIRNGGAFTVANAQYTDSSNTVITLPYVNVDIEVQEPNIVLSKTFTPITSDAGDQVLVTVIATNIGSATAYNLRVLDDLSLATRLSYLGNVSGTDPPDLPVDTTLGVRRPIFRWNTTNLNYAIAPGATRTFTYRVLVGIGAQPLEVISNNALNPMQAKWDSLPGQGTVAGFNTVLNSTGFIGADGSATGLRNGVLPNVVNTLNDYQTATFATLTMPAVTISKTDLTPAVVPAIGAYKNFQIDINLPEGSTQNVVLTDNLAVGTLAYLLANNVTRDITYTFQGISTINGVAPAETAFTAFPVDGTNTSAIWNIGTVVTTSEDDTAPSPAITPLIRINYSARIDNAAGTDAGDTLRNSAVATYRNGASGASVSTVASAPAQITVVEPLITLTKSVANITTPLAVPIAGDTLRYTLTLTAANGALNSTAYDIAITDTLSASLQYINNSTTLNAVAFANPIVSAGPILNWSLPNANIDIAAGSTFTLVYDVTVLNQPGTNMTNASLVQWTSLNGADTFERDGSNAFNTGLLHNDYFTSTSVNSPPFADTTAFTKVRMTDTYGASDANVRIGEVVDYQLTITLPEGTTLATNIVDVLPQGLRFESIVSVNGAVAPYINVAPFTHTAIATPTITGNPMTGPTTATWNIGNIVNAADGDLTNNNFVIVYRARVLNGALAQGLGVAQTLTNTATFNYTNTTTTGITRNAALTLQQPMLAVTKTSNPVSGSVIAAGDLITYTVSISNSGTAPAYDVQLRDVIPLGMRTAGVTMVGATLLPATALLTTFAPVYSSTTGITTWNFDTGVADAYTIPAGATLRLVYRVQADAGLSAGLTMTNQAQVQDYCSFDNNAVPTAGTVTGVRQCYGTSNTATSTLNTAAANPLGKINNQATAAIGDQFTYRITVPATPMVTALYDVRILDNLASSLADMSYVSITQELPQLTGQTWTPVVTEVPAKNLVITGSGTGIDIPAGEQVVFTITVVLNNSVTNSSGLAFQNIASYTFNQFNGDIDTQTVGGPNSGATTTMTIVGPDTLIMQKSGPVTMRIGVPGNFTLNVQNTGTGTAWDMKIEDILPNPVPGGMCDTTPSSITARVYLADGVTPVSAVLTQGSDYVVSFANATPTATECTLTLQMQTAAASLAPTQRLIVTYQASLDADNPGGITLINIAGATQWFSGNTQSNVATGQIRTYTRTITDGTPSTLDHEDARSILTESPILEFRKSVINVTTGQNPGANASPGDLLRYTITIRNVSTLAISSFTLIDELDRLNATAMFLPGSLSLISTPAGSSATLTNAIGGSKGTGLVNISNLSIAAQGLPNDTLTIVFEARLAAVINSGIAVLNQAQLPSIVSIPLNSDDPNVNGPDNPAILGDEDPTRTVIASAPVFQVRKTSQDITADPLVLLAGERLRYTITVKNIGTENASSAMLRDPLPPNTSYVANSTTLNGVAVADAGVGVSALQAGMLINAPENLTAGVMRADSSAITGNIATITFVVQINSNVVNGTIISNQGYVNGSGLGSGVFPEKPSDDPATLAVDDPTLNVVGNLPLLVALKTVAIQVDNNSIGILDPLDVLRYTITISNLSLIPATGVTFTDLVPANTTYVADTVTLNGSPVGVPDGGVSPLISTIGVASPASAVGTIDGSRSAVITFDVQVNVGVPTGTIISNQGTVNSTELPSQLTDADGNSGNGFQPTTIVVGNAQLLTISKQVSVVGGGPALAGGQLEYLVRVTNISSVAASNVVITDNLSLAPLATQVIYVAGFPATLNGLTTGVSVAGAIITATQGALAPGATAQLRFRVQIAAGLPIGTRITNTGQVVWSAAPALTASASVSIDVGGTPGSATLNGQVWHDANIDNIAGAGELNLAGWSVGVFRNNVLLGSVLTDTLGLYSISGLPPTTSELYAIKFLAPGAVASTAKLGLATSVFTNGMQEIASIIALSGNNLQNLNSPIQPNGVVYNSILRTPATGVMLTLRTGAGSKLQPACFNDSFQQDQVTLASGYYKFDLNFSDPSCPAPGGEYLIEVTSPSNFMPGQSLIIPPITSSLTAAFSVPTCQSAGVGDAILGNSYCEVQTSEFAPGVAVPANTAATNYYLKVALNNTSVPLAGRSQIFNNHIAMDPRLDNAVTITKIASLQNVTKGQIIPYTITVSNTLPVTLTNLNVVDTFPAGFKFVKGSGRLDGQPVEPEINNASRRLTWGNLQLATNTKRVFQLMLIVGSGVKEGKYINRAQIFNTTTGGAASPEASATVRVIPDPTLDCSDLIGKVFDDANLNGYQDEGEAGLPGVRVVTARGLIVTADKFGRFHITCAVVPDPDRGSNFILKMDDRSLPSGYRLTTENPRVQRATRGKMLKFNFGAAIHKVVKLDMADAVFEPGTSEMRVQWKQRIELLMAELKKSASVLRLSYLAEAENESLVNDRLKLVQQEIAKLWKKKQGSYDLTIETEVFWRSGEPPQKSGVSN